MVMKKKKKNNLPKKKMTYVSNEGYEFLISNLIYELYLKPLLFYYLVFKRGNKWGVMRINEKRCLGLFSHKKEAMKCASRRGASRIYVQEKNDLQCWKQVNKNEYETQVSYNY